MGLVPVVALGVALAASFRAEARERGLAEARSEARLVARTAVEPLLDGRPLSEGLTATETAALKNLASRVLPSGDLLRLRLRDLEGNVVFSGDGSGFGGEPDDEAVDAAHGELISILTRLNADANDHGPAGVRAVEVYRPLVANGRTPVGVLEAYLPYAPIERDVHAGLTSLYRDLAIGLALLYLAVFAMTVSVSRGLRRLVAANAFMAEHDALTGLPNRTLFHSRVEEALAGSDGRRPVAVAIVDLDRFKEINDTLGHHNGDVVLQALAERLDGHMAAGDLVARLGGDEFGVVLRTATDPAAALGALRGVIDQEIELSGLPVTIEASIGFAVGPVDGSHADELLRRADVAMYAAKAQHAGVLRYDARQNQYDAANLSLAAELRNGIEAGELVLHYQPKVGMPSGRVEAVEALVRWQHPKHGLLSPDRFIPLAEQTDLIEALTDRVLRTALTEIRTCGTAPVAVAVNVSARSLAKDDFAARVISALDETGMPPSRLIIEITETALLDDPERAASTLRRLSRIGVRISIDDFGKGQTSLGYLAALPVHELKIDRTFVHDILDNAAHDAIVRSIVDLGHNLSLKVVGEGVETDDVLAALQESGCDLAQGYLLARPMPADALGGWLTRFVEPEPVPEHAHQH